MKNDDMFIACQRTGHLCNRPFKSKDPACKRCLKQIKDGIIEGKKDNEEK